MIIILDDLKIQSCDDLFYILNNDVQISCSTRNMSSLGTDSLDEKYFLNSWIFDYLRGKITPVNNIFNIDYLPNLPIVEQIDINFRMSTGGIKELFEKLTINQFINSPRLYSIALNEGLKSIIDIYRELKNSSWFDLYYNGQKSNFEYVLSDDLSAKKIGLNFYLHEGTNNWNKCWLLNQVWSAKWNQQLTVWQDQLKKTEDRVKLLCNKDYLIVVIPEKDSISRFITNDFKNSSINPLLFMSALNTKIDKNKFLFPLYDLVSLGADLDFKQPESHLTPECYWKIFTIILSQWDLDSVLNNTICISKISDKYGDLRSKFPPGVVDNPVKTLESFDCNNSSITYGAKEFMNPLRNSFVRWTNESAPIKSSLLILGDSHSSLGDSPYLTSIFSFFFEEVSFYWNPCYLYDVELDKKNYDYCLCEISQRFIFPIMSD